LGSISGNNHAISAHFVNITSHMKSPIALLLTITLASAAAVAQTATTPKTPATAKKPATSTAKKPGTTVAKKPAAAGSVTTLKDTKEKFSYALGLSLGTNLHQQDVDIDPNIVAQGLKDASSNGKHLLTDQEAAAVLTQMQGEVRQKQMAKMKEMESKNKADGAAFLAANRAKPGVVTLPSGLQYKIITAGTGPKPTASDTVVCNYRGTLTDGKEFDSSYKRGQPATFPVSGVIKGWTEALQLMPVGSKWQLVIPAELGYGDRGAGADIAPGSTLVFEVELLSIQSKEEPKAEQPKPEGTPDKK
jgi:FKBP-type peptidyl-prolyl cis-trans isomerase FklB